MLKFYWNGIKENGGKLQRAHYSRGGLANHPEGTITIYARDYGPFSAEVRQAFKVENDTDIMTDYFDKDTIRVEPAHPLYQQVKTAHDAQRAHSAKREAKWNERRGIVMTGGAT